MVLSLMIAIIGHEIMHGYVALKYGDTTAKKHGRLTINPIPHIDIVGTIILPATLIIFGAPFLFGWAKPVPIDQRVVLKNGGYLGAIYVALAGVAYNFALALLAVAILKNYEFSGVDGFILFTLLKNMLIINLVLAVFNLWPIPPLDGSKALLYFCMNFGIKSLVNLYYSVEKYGMIILLIILMTPLKNIFFAPVQNILNFLLMN
jgi:Zn-dependent protease